MGAKASIVLADGQSSPANHTFSNLRSQGDMQSWSDKSGGIAIGQPSIEVSIRRPQRNAPSNRVRVSVTLPTLEVTSPATGSGYQPVPKVAYAHLATIDIVSPDRGVLAERKNILAFAKNVLADAQVVAAVHDAEMPT